MTKIAIVGGGPAGAFCAIVLKNLLIETAPNIKASITIFEKDKILKTILPTGGTRCNLANAIFDFKELASNYPRGEKFLYSIFSRFNTDDTLKYFKKLGIDTYTQPDKRIFPVSNSSAQVRYTFLKALEKVNIIKKEITSRKEVNDYDLIVIAGGSKGAYKLAQDFGHTITPLKPSLCAFITDKVLHTGVTLKNVKIFDIYTKSNYKGDILFTHNGISGPVIYQISSVNAYRTFPYELKLEIINENDLKKEIEKYPKKNFINILNSFIPKTLALNIIKTCCNENTLYKQAAHITKEELQNVCTLTLKVKGTAKGGETVTAGGVCLDEINSKNCKSKLVPNLYFCGEVMDIDGLCGGFNLQNCWSSAFCVASDIAQSLTR